LKDRKPFTDRLTRACKKDRVLAELVLGKAPATTAARILLLRRCSHWCFTVSETATLIEALDSRTADDGADLC
jgi:hypothetical protein